MKKYFPYFIIGMATLIGLLAIVTGFIFLYNTEKAAAYYLEAKHYWLDILNVEVFTTFTADESKTILFITAIKSDPNLDSGSIPVENVKGFFLDSKVVAKYLYKKYPNIDEVVLLLCSWQPDGSINISYMSIMTMDGINRFGEKAPMMTIYINKPINMEKVIWRGRFK